MKVRTAVIYGDSISARQYGAGGYEALIKQELSIDVIHNHAISASGLAEGTPDCLVRLLEDPSKLHPEAELVILWHGTNDWYWGVEAGDPESRDSTRFAGALRNCVGKIRSVSPGAVIILLTPLWRYQAPDGDKIPGDAWLLPNRAGTCQKEIYDMVFEMGRRLNIPVLDIRKLSGIGRHNWEQLLPDMVHPSEEGYRIICRFLCDFIRTL